MSLTDLQRYTEACNYPGILDAAAVEKHLRGYLAALGVKRQIVRLNQGWTLDEHPSLAKAIDETLNDFAKRSPSARAARDARAALDARALVG